MSDRAPAGKRSRRTVAAEPETPMPSEFLRIPGRHLTVESPVIHIPLGPGDRALVHAGQRIDAGAPLAECTSDPQLIEAGRLIRSGGNGHDNERGHDGADEALYGGDVKERRSSPQPGKWWTGGDERRGKAARRERGRRLGGTLLYSLDGRWAAAAGERHETVESPVGGVVVQARSCIGIAIKIDGVAIPAAVGGGRPTRAYLEGPHVVEGELREASLDVGGSGTIVVAGGRLSTEAITRARAMSIRGIVAGSVGQTELRDLAASEARQRAALHSMLPFGVLGFDGYQRRPIASPILALLAAVSGREVAILTDPPMLVLEMQSVGLPDLPPDAVRVRTGSHAGREGRWLSSAGLYRFRAGVHLEAANVRLGDDPSPTVVPVADLERFIV